MDWSWDISLVLLLKVLKIPLNVSELMSNRQNELKSLLDMSEMMSYRQKVKIYIISIVNLSTFKLIFN
jgi:hypothetical protein